MKNCISPCIILFSLLFLSCQKKTLAVIPVEIRGEWIILSHMPFQGSLQDGVEKQGAAFAHVIRVKQDGIQEIHLRTNHQTAAVSNLNYQVLSVHEAPDAWRLELEQLKEDKTDTELKDRYFSQHIELIFHGDETEWRFHYDTWNYKVYYCIRPKDLSNYPVFDCSKDTLSEVIPREEKVYDK